MNLEKTYLACKQRAEQHVINMNDNEFLAWLDLSSESATQKEDLLLTLKRFEELEAFEKCALIRDYIKLL